METMRIWALLMVLAGCGGMPQAMSADLGPDDLARAPAAADLANAGLTPAGFGAPCSSSSDCTGFKVDAGPGFLGCGSYLGIDYCTIPCGKSAGGALCWAGTTCACVDRVNVSGFDETDCYCAKP